MAGHPSESKGDEVGVVGGADCTEERRERCGVRFPHLSVMTLVTNPPGAPGGRPKTLIPEAASRLNTCRGHS